MRWFSFVGRNARRQRTCRHIEGEYHDVIHDDVCVSDSQLHFRPPFLIEIFPDIHSNNYILYARVLTSTSTWYSTMLKNSKYNPVY